MDSYFNCDSFLLKPIFLKKSKPYLRVLRTLTSSELTAIYMIIFKNNSFEPTRLFKIMSKVVLHNALCSFGRLKRLYGAVLSHNWWTSSLSFPCNDKFVKKKGWWNYEVETLKLNFHFLAKCCLLTATLMWCLQDSAFDGAFFFDIFFGGAFPWIFSFNGAFSLCVNAWICCACFP